MYTVGNPVRYSDPTGHMRPTDEDHIYVSTPAERIREKARIALFRVVHGEQAGQGKTIKEYAGHVLLNRAILWDDSSYSAIARQAYREEQFTGVRNASVHDYYNCLLDDDATKSIQAVDNLLRWYQNYRDGKNPQDPTGEADFFGNIWGGEVVLDEKGQVRGRYEDETTLPEGYTHCLALDIYEERFEEKVRKRIPDAFYKTIKSSSGKLFIYNSFDSVTCYDLNPVHYYKPGE